MRRPTLRPEAKLASPIDGVPRTEAEERSLDILVLEVLGGGRGAQLMDYLRGLTLRTVSGPAVSDQELRHREGQRHLVWMLEARLKLERERQ